MKQMQRTIPCLLILLPLAGCGDMVRAASGWVQRGDPANGVTYYVGGAGPIGNIGSISVPEGLQDAGYKGYVEVYPWQSLTAAIDQIALERNRIKGRRLAEQIRAQKKAAPHVPVNVIGLSAGTAIAAFALERLPEDIKVENVVFIASSLSSRYDLTRAMRRVRGGVFAFYSRNDQILGQLIPMTGTVDRRDADEGVAGLQGFRKPRRRARDTDEQYLKLHNVRYREEFAAFGYEGGHTDATNRQFVAHVIGPLLMRGVPRATTTDDGPPPADNTLAAPR